MPPPPPVTVTVVAAEEAVVPPPPVSTSSSTPTTSRSASPTTPVNIVAVRSPWERISLGSDLELHVRRPQSRDDNRRVERIIEAALRILNEP